MSTFNQSRILQNLVANIDGKKIYLRNMSDQMIDTIKGMGAFRMAFGTELVWLIECADEDEPTKTLQELNRLGFLFVGEPTCWPPAAVFAFFLEKNKLNDKFKEVRWRGPKDWFLIER